MMQELTARQVQINDAFWSPRLAVNAQKAILHQWEQLEATRCIDNFRIAAGQKEGFREGYFFADSDAYKWLDAASRIYALHPQPELASLMDSFIALLARAQMPDGYLFTYNQIHFPNQRWVNLQVEHELYCHGHLIEAGISHYEATGRRDLLDIGSKAADLLVRDFLNASSDKTCGHEEIEIALIRLYRVTNEGNYLELAHQFVERRGRIPFFPLHLWRQFSTYKKREAFVNQKRKDYIAAHPEHAAFHLPGGNRAKKPRFSGERWYLNALSGLYAQQHAPIRKQTAPEGHSVRFGYLETAIAMLLREQPEDALLSTLQQAWERMVTRRMYVTGGLGAVPGLEGFGKDFELNPEYAYAETCASIASLLWNWEMALLTKDARYSDLFEWQLYNAASVGMGQHGNTYLYHNPLEVHDGVTRKPWYIVPCCPSNLSRIFADLGKCLCSFDESNLWIHQYISSEITLDIGEPVGLRIESGLPWNGRVLIHMDPAPERALGIFLRVPSWDPFATMFLHEPIDQQLKHNSDFVHSPGVNGVTQYFKQKTASSYDPRWSSFTFVRKLWSPGDVLEFKFDLSIKLRRAHPKVKGHAGKGAVTRGPLVYCLESVDNPGVDIFTAQLDPTSLQDEFAPDLLGGCVVIHGKTTDGKPLKFIPYFLWANRGESQMTVWVNA
ncbi:MAG TPA: beta-L-arabinofuranosidase domain-containing protein [Anaerolineales bacterium]|nr:beta-L-arabinofuranosidase domain-containing protein [Anaerolineales bacterium]